ncbi:MAG: response regulator transcription factor [Armatimonadetes bacterium]|nr:response regulator transcription factor [Armatimonadota bacterium]
MSGAQADRILVVDDDVQIRRALQRALAMKGYQAIFAASGEEALEIAALELPAMVILDLSLPGISGLEVCQELRNWFKSPILVLSVRDRDTDKITALDLGADDYLTKPFSVDELLARIRAHLRRVSSTAYRKPLFEINGLKIDLSKRRVFLNSEEVKLTRTEFALLSYLVENAGRVITHGQLLTRVWGPEYAGDIQTLRVHIGNLRRKMERDPGRPEFILTEPGVGYRLVDEPKEGQSFS